jgi:hypothetical protein
VINGPPGPQWWLASDGRSYPPEAHPDPSKRPGWWLARDGRWYPPETHPDPSKRPGWWLASDGKWYPPRVTPRKQTISILDAVALGLGCLSFFLFFVAAFNEQNPASDCEGHCLTVFEQGQVLFLAIAAAPCAAGLVLAARSFSRSARGDGSSKVVSLVIGGWLVVGTLFYLGCWLAILGNGTWNGTPVSTSRASRDFGLSLVVGLGFGVTFPSRIWRSKRQSSDSG